ncbi:hypothetical protein [Actinopolymorpha pittospori]|uniref:Uncharacterized protein n=1 Tax=Actinopolymorpha pittospori TaxID=648752 RepID=A0A927MWX6_9ACTN|nr:hypothetical protein [Actinopolymorpha pittospori]MBE1606268.1 hypothetical protein [Actinopolymorpha pittospori]
MPTHPSHIATISGVYDEGVILEHPEADAPEGALVWLHADGSYLNASAVESLLAELEELLGAAEPAVDPRRVAAASKAVEILNARKPSLMGAQAATAGDVVGLAAFLLDELTSDA